MTSGLIPAQIREILGAVFFHAAKLAD